MAIHVPGFLNWGDISLAASLSGGDVKFIDPVTMSGQALNPLTLRNYQTEFDTIRRKCSQPGKTILNNNLKIFGL